MINRRDILHLPLGSTTIAGLLARFNEAVAAREPEQAPAGVAPQDRPRWGDISVMNFGAIPNDPEAARTNVAAFNAAINAGPIRLNKRQGVRVYVPSGVWFLDDSIVINVEGTKFNGAGIETTQLLTSHPSAPVIKVDIPFGLSNYVSISDLTLDRSVPAVAGGDGVYIPCYLQYGLIENLYVKSQWNGINLTSASYGIVMNVVAVNCLNHGFVLANSMAVPPEQSVQLQWSFINTMSEGNAGCGYTVQSRGPLPASNKHITLSPWIYPYSYANSMTGISVTVPPGDTGVIDAFVLIGGFLVGDAQSELILQTNGGISHQVIGSYFENCGISAHGPGLAGAPTLQGHGIHLANNADVTISGSSVVQTPFSGIRVEANTCGVEPEITISGCRIVNNNYAKQRFAGVDLAAGVIATVNGSRIGNQAGSNQAYGVTTGDARRVSVVGCDLRGNLSAALNAPNLPAMVASGNLGWVSKNGGNQRINNLGGLVIAHGLSAIPQSIVVTPTAPLIAANGLPITLYIGAVDINGFVINFSAPPPPNAMGVSIYWTAWCNTVD